ncbi:MAG TPA: alpha/beta fold hydrolase [Acidimicrobiales bacterium]
MSLLGLQRDGSGPVLVWLHGFTQTKNSAHEFRSILTGTYEVLTIDLPSHGENAAVSASLEETADLLAEVLPQEPFVLGGYSMGGRVALHFALRHPERLAGLFLLSATLGIQNNDERRARRERDDKLAERIEEIGTDQFLSEWLAQPMFATLPLDPQERAARSRDALGLANSLRHAGSGTQNWLGDEVTELDVPTTLVVGSKDKKFINEGQQLNERLAHPSLSIIHDAGHAAHLEQPDAVAHLLRRRQLQ